ncbi:cytochrome P450 [Propioniciclava coleopterorum]|uniref:Cytochrome P450 n=1 Tax=Propioniciclava coleopterorum TaxID=2714937 RepID=A0A6G7Y5W8_9ACTN|nr:cytochrome P450 [Propioniciclava coleopterorum]QIK72109.1 cytochrome P450 [Propioniciclava coleopterorum]
MTDHLPEEISPAGRDARALTDALRHRNPVVHNVRDEWVLLRHADVKAAALDDATFSSAVSAHLQIPNGLDGDEHTRFRAALDPFLTPEAIAPAEPLFAALAARLASELPRGDAIDAVDEIGAVFAVRAQSAWLGWPAELEDPLVAWVSANHAASRAGDRDRLAAVAAEFDALIESVLAPRRGPGGEVLGDDLTSALMRVEVDGRPLRHEEIVSVLRNWTGGDLGSIALCVGVLLHDLASQPDLQRRLRAGVGDAELDAAIDELLRIDDPFVSNRRVTTCPVTMSGVDIPAGAKVKLHWTSANRDEAVFGDPDGFDPVGHAADNLVYGIGRHVCPGRTLATVELRIAVRALLEATSWIDRGEDHPVREVHPVGGWAAVPVILT